ncbi:MAG: hypothetical protein AABW65_01600 [Nanoarchaeota archaeon]
MEAKMIRARENLIGAWAFFSGIVLAVLIGIFAGSKINPPILGILAFLGIVVGYFVAEKDVNTFLLASVSLVIVSYMGISGLVLGAAISGINIGKIISVILQTLLALFVPATIVVALKTVFSISKS